jgi:hypothetical protein
LNIAELLLALAEKKQDGYLKKQQKQQQPQQRYYKTEVARIHAVRGALFQTTNAKARFFFRNATALLRSRLLQSSALPL